MLKDLEVPYLWENCYVTVDYTTFENNTVGANGGGISSKSSTV